MKSKSHTGSVNSWSNASRKEWHDWKWQYNNRIQTIPQLIKVFPEKAASLDTYRNVVRFYPLSITPFYLSLMNVEDDNDPIRRQCFPDGNETDTSFGGVDDPLEEGLNMPVPGLIHRYPDRCVAMITNSCATYCRHCNRKRMWKRNITKDYTRYLDRMTDYVSKTSGIREVIVSGGDPLTMDEEILDRFLGSLRSIPHIEVLRIGSRIPVVLPMRITRRLCLVLRKYRPLWFNTQFNHPHEITPEAARACEMLLEAGMPVLNQSVLLRGVNDNYETMRDLLHGLQRISVKPYYLFQCDPVKGTDHFRSDIFSGIKIMDKLWRNISGLCLPQYVVDVPGMEGKLPLYPFSGLLTGGLEKKQYFFDMKGEVH